MTLLIDMNLSPRLAGLLAAAGFDALHWTDCGDSTATDAAIMAYAKVRGWIVVTNDLDFGSILAATGADRPSVVQIRGLSLAPEVVVGPLAAAMRQCSEELAQGAILTIDADRLRVRLLPFREA